MQLGPCRIEFQRDAKGGVRLVAEGVVAIILAVGFLCALTYLFAETFVPYLQTPTSPVAPPQPTLQNERVLRLDFATANPLM